MSENLENIRRMANRGTTTAFNVKDSKNLDMFQHILDNYGLVKKEIEELEQENQRLERKLAEAEKVVEAYKEYRAVANSVYLQQRNEAFDKFNALLSDYEASKGE